MNDKPVLFIKISSHSERRILEAGKGLYDGILIEASFSGFSDNTLSILKKQFIIEPKSYIFALNPKFVRDQKTGYPKGALFNMSKIYGPPISHLFNQRPVNYLDFNNTSEAGNLTKKVLEYQRVKLSRQESLFDNYYDKYRDGPDEKLEKKLLFCLLPPYFFPNQNNNGIQGLNLQFIDIAMKEKKDNEKVFAVIPLDISFFRNGNSIKKLCDDYISLGSDGYFLFINKFDELNAGMDELSALISVVKLLAYSKKPVFKLYGGYFSALLTQIGLTGFSCGLGHGESKNIYATFFKGSPTPKYYIPILHKNFILKELPVLLKKFPEFECQCPVCRNPVDPGFFDQEIKRKQHFILARKAEIDHLNKLGINKAIKEMESISLTYNKRGLGIEYLERWCKVLSKS